MKTFVLLFVCLTFFAIEPHAQVTQLNNNNSLHVEIPLPVDVPLGSSKTIVVSGIDSSIWVTDATVAGTIPISTDIKFERSAGLIGGKLIFSGTTAATGSEIYITDGTAGGTMIVKDIVPGPTGSVPGDMVFLNGFIYFSAVTPLEGRELWKTDGTALGTTLVKDIFPGAGGSNGLDSFELFSNGTYLLFAAKTASSGTELWKSDGTDAGTVLLKDINLNPLADSSSSNPRSFFKYNNLVLFVATDTAHGEEVWETDGTTPGTVLLKDIRTGRPSSTTVVFFPGLPEINIFQGFHLFNNNVYFNVSDGTSNGQIWKSDGTTANTVLLKDILNASFPNIAEILLLGAVNLPTKFIFALSNGTNRSELWESDGTTGGTKLFKAFSPATPTPPFILLGYSINFASQNLNQLLFQGNKFFFVAGTAASGEELWITDGADGTPAHTNMVADISPGAGDGISNDFTSYVYTSTALFFAANDGVNGNELWKSDGTQAGTTMVKDINPGAANSNPELPFFVSNGKVIFSATDGDDATNTDLYVVDGIFSPLPITLSEFTVTLKAADALLQWSTLNEINTKDFTVQRSYDGQHFENIGNVPASNSSSSKHDYSFIDKDISNSGKSIIYYRILTSDKDGKSAGTNIIFIKLKGNTSWMVRLLSNPVQNFASVMLTGITGDLKLSIRDINGKILYSNSRQNINGQINIPVAILGPGMYVLVAEANHEKQVIKFIKQ